MKTIVFLFLVASSALGIEQANRVIASSDKDLSIRYVWIADDPTGEAYIHSAILQRAWELPWSFSGRGRAMLFSWSPDARYLLVGLVKPGKDMSLYWLDARAKTPKERNLNLEAIERRVDAALPERDPDRGESVALASHHQIDFERIEWLSVTQCRLPYISQNDRKSGEATLSLLLGAAETKLKLEKVTPAGPR